VGSDWRSPAPLAAPPEVRHPLDLVASTAIWRTSRVTDRPTVTSCSSPAASERGFRRADLRRGAGDGLSILASLARNLEDLDRVTGWVKALGFVNCAEGFNVTPAAINGFGDLILALWGDPGRHAFSDRWGELRFGRSRLRQSSRWPDAGTGDHRHRRR
jgi:hypothetical protein